LCQKKTKKKILKSHSRQSKRWEPKKKSKKNRPISQPVADYHVSGVGLFPPFETAGMGKRTKKKNSKNESGSFWKFFLKGGQT